QWDGRDADPYCTCPAGPVCKHAYALARAIDAARPDRDAMAAEAERTRAREARANERHAFRGFDPRLEEPWAEPVPEDLAEDLNDWVHRRTATPGRTLRVVIGLEAGAEGGRPEVWLEARLTSSRLADAPRSTQHLLQLAADLRRDPLALAPPHARLLRVLAGTLPH